MRKIYAEREALGKTLSDTSDLVNNVGVMIGAVLAVVVVGAFFVLISSRIALDRTAFELDRLDREIAAEESRYWELRLEVTELQSPERIRELADEIPDAHLVTFHYGGHLVVAEAARAFNRAVLEFLAGDG